MNKNIKVVIIGAGFAGLNASKLLGNKKNIDVTLLDRNNHHLFQPLLYQVAMAGLSPADIAEPIRSIVSKYKNIQVLKAEAKYVNTDKNKVITDFGELDFDYLILACGANHSYFGKQEWEPYAPGLKSLEEATEIRRRVLDAFEEAEKTQNPQERQKKMTFVIVGGGPTGVELAGAIGEMSRFTLSKDFRNIDSQLTRIILVEAGPRILASFSPLLAEKALFDLRKLGVEVWTSSTVTHIDEDGCKIGSETIHAGTTLWAAGVEASRIGQESGIKTDSKGRILVQNDLSIPQHPHIFAAGDLALLLDKEGKNIPGMAPAAIQQGRCIAKNILKELEGKERKAFQYWDKGQMATIGRSHAILEVGKIKMSGYFAWLAWLVVHIYYLTGFDNRILVLIQWAWSYVSFKKGARLILNKEWRKKK